MRRSGRRTRIIERDDLNSPAIQHQKTMTEPKDDLARCREEIERIDSDIIALLAQRVDAVHRTCSVKTAAGLSVRDANREEAVLDKCSAAAENDGLPSDRVLDLFRSII